MHRWTSRAWFQTLHLQFPVARGAAAVAVCKTISMVPVDRAVKSGKPIPSTGAKGARAPLPGRLSALQETPAGIAPALSLHHAWRTTNDVREKLSSTS